MAYRGGRDSRERIFEERDTYRTGTGPRRHDREEIDIYERQEIRREDRRSPPRGPPVREYEETDIRIRERERDRTPAWMRDEGRRQETGGALVLRQRDVETIERPRPRPRSPSRERIEIRDRIVERERDSRIRSPSRGPPVERVRTRFVERERERSPSPPPVERVRTRIIERERERSPSPIVHDRERIRIIERERERIPSPSPSPPPAPPVIRGPTIERDIITHYHDVDHGMVVLRPPSPPPPPRPAPRQERAKERELDIDIHTGRHHTEVDIHETSRDRSRVRRGRSPSHERPSPAYQRRRAAAYDDEVIVRSDRNKLSVDIEEHRHRRSRSAAPPMSPPVTESSIYDDEAEYITSRINERGRMGEAWHGHTKDWTIVDVPPGTERVRMDGVGGGAAEVTWQRYNGVRRARFIPEREPDRTASLPLPEAPAERDRDRERVSVQIHDGDREVDVEKVTDRRITLRPALPQPAPPKRSEMWTEITKDLVVREAIEECGYDYEETEWFYYVMQYLRYEDVLELVQLSDEIRRVRKDRIREIQWERDYRDHHRHPHHHHSHHRPPRWDNEERVTIERDVVYSDRSRGYIR